MVSEGVSGMMRGRGGDIVCLGILLGIAVMDVRTRKIPVEVLILANISAFVYRVGIRKEAGILLIGGIAVGGIFLLISKVTGESLGYGDSLGILGLGIYLGFWKVLEVLSGAFFLAALAAVFALARSKMSRKCGMPFYPYLTASYVMWVIMSVGENV